MALKRKFCLNGCKLSKGHLVSPILATMLISFSSHHNHAKRILYCFLNNEFVSNQTWWMKFSQRLWKKPCVKTNMKLTNEQILAVWVCHVSIVRNETRNCINDKLQKNFKKKESQLAPFWKKLGLFFSDERFFDFLQKPILFVPFRNFGPKNSYSNELTQWFF